MQCKKSLAEKLGIQTELSPEVIALLLLMVGDILWEFYELDSGDIQE